MTQSNSSLASNLEQSDANQSQADFDTERHNRKMRARYRRSAGPPEQRNLRIFKMAEIEHVPHWEIARHFGLTRSRVTQIVTEVKQTIAQAAPDDPEIKDHLARRRYEQALDKFRLEYALQVTGRALRDPPKTLTTRRFGDRDRDGKKETWEEQTSRDQKLDVQAVKAYLKTADALRKLADQVPIAPGEPEKLLSNDELLISVHAVLHQFVNRAHLSPDRPCEQFLALIRGFRDEIYHWVSEVRCGTPQALAWSNRVQRVYLERVLTSSEQPLTSLTSPPTLTNLASPPAADPTNSATPASPTACAIPVTSSLTSNTTG